MKKIKKAINILRTQGLKPFLNKLGDFFNEQGRNIKKIVQRIYFFLCKNIIIKKIKTINIDSPKEMQNMLARKFMGIFNPQQVPSEFNRLLEIFIEKKPKVIMEIGTANGGSLFSWSKLAPDDATIISVDLPEGNFGGGYPKWKIPFYQAFTKQGQSLNLIRGNSHKVETLEQAKKILNGRTVDFLFIDGDHTYEGVKNDFEFFSPLVKKGGVVAFHDVAIHPPQTGCFVHDLWVKLEDKYKEKAEEIIENQNQGWAGIGVLYF